MDEIGVHDRKVAAVRHGIEQLFAHAHQRSGSARREIEPAQQFLPAWLGGLMDLAGGHVVRIGLPDRDRLFHARLVGTELLGQGFEERDPRADGQRPVTVQDFPRQRDPGRFAPPRQQVLAQHHEIGRACDRVCAPRQKFSSAI